MKINPGKKALLNCSKRKKKMNQKRRATKNKEKSERRITRKLAVWVKDIVTNYRIGNTTVSETSVPILANALRTSYIQAGQDVLRFDIREYKQKDDDLRNEIYTSIAIALALQYERRTDLAMNSSTRTARKWAERTTELAIENGWTQREADIALANYLKGQRLTIATTESQWVVEATRNTAVMKVKDPLGNTIERIIALLESNNINEAMRLSRQVSKLARLPNSISQGDIIRLISDNRDRLTVPVVQAETIAGLRRQARRLEANKKQWQTIGGGDVRKTHQRANGQIRNIEEPFNLDGGDLQYPGDSSLGAGLEEIINCRCATVYL